MCVCVCARARACLIFKDTTGKSIAVKEGGQAYSASKSALSCPVTRGVQ